MDPVLATLRNTAVAKRFQDWATTPAIEYWGRFCAETQGVSGQDLLTDAGWTVTSVDFANGAGASFPDAGWATLDVGTGIGTATFGAAGDLIASPPVFGSLDGFLTAARKLGSTRPPRTLQADWLGSFSDASNNETASGQGFFEDGGSPAVAADHFAMVFSNGTTFNIRSGAATGTVISALAVVNTPIFHRIVMDRVTQLIYWWTSTDGITYTLRSTLALQANELPVGWGAGVLAATGANFQILYGDVRIAYF